LKDFYLWVQKHQKFSRKWLKKFSLKAKKVIFGVWIFAKKVMKNKKVARMSDFSSKYIGIGFLTASTR
jgi:cell division inhibitor SulA